MRKKTIIISFVDVKVIVKETHKKLNTIKVQVDKTSVNVFPKLFNQIAALVHCDEER
jgi:hypothetical protein